jgi:hypothetical protein
MRECGLTATLPWATIWLQFAFRHCPSQIPDYHQKTIDFTLLRRRKSDAQHAAIRPPSLSVRGERKLRALPVLSGSSHLAMRCRFAGMERMVPEEGVVQIVPVADAL